MKEQSDEVVERKLYGFYTYTFLENFVFFAPVMIPFFTDWGNLNQFQIQTLQSWFMCVMFISQLPTGLFADRYSRKYSLAIGSLLAAIAIVVYTRVSDFGIFLLGETLFGLGYAFISSADRAFAYETLAELGREDLKERVFGVAYVMKMLAMLSAAPIGSWVGSHWGVVMPMLLSSIPILLSALCALFLREPRVCLKSKCHHINGLARVKAALLILKTERRLGCLVLDMTLVAIAAYFVVWTYQRLLEEVGIPIGQFGYFLIGQICIQIIAALQFGKIRCGSGAGHKFLVLSALTTAIGFVLVSLWLNIWTVIIFLVFGGIALTRETLINAMICPHIPSDQRATVLSAIGMIKQLVLFLLNPLIGALIDLSLPWALIVISVFPLFAFLLSRNTKWTLA